MPRSARNDEDGFTLVELSIVLVIIGLLIGGILAAQSMVSTSKIQAVAQQIGQFDAGVENFKTKYNYLPGDAKAFGGNGDGAISSGGTYVALCGGEMLNFWNNIFPDQYVNTYTGQQSQAFFSGANKNVPLSKLGSNNAFFLAIGISTDGSSVDLTNIQNYYALMDGGS